MQLTIYHWNNSSKHPSWLLFFCIILCTAKQANDILFQRRVSNATVVTGMIYSPGWTLVVMWLSPQIRTPRHVQRQRTSAWVSVPPWLHGIGGVHCRPRKWTALGQAALELLRSCWEITDWQFKDSVRSMAVDVIFWELLGYWNI